MGYRLFRPFSGTAATKDSTSSQEWSPEHEQTLAQQWETLLAQTSNVYSQYQSLHWWKHIQSAPVDHTDTRTTPSDSPNASESSDAPARAVVSVPHGKDPHWLIAELQEPPAGKSQTGKYRNEETNGQEDDTQHRLRSLAIIRKAPFRHSVASRPVPVGITYPSCVELLGSEVLGADSSHSLHHFFNYLFATLPDVHACHCKSVRAGTVTHEFLNTIRWPAKALTGNVPSVHNSYGRNSLDDDSLGHRPHAKDTVGNATLRNESSVAHSHDSDSHGKQHSKIYSALFLEEDRNFYTIELPESFDEYLQKFKRKKRYNLKRQLRTLAEEGEGDVSLTCITAKKDIPEFAIAAFTIYARSWKADELAATLGNMAGFTQSLNDLADQNMLRAYLLRKGDIPVAYILGYDYGHIFHYSDIAFDDAYSHHSPGNGLLYLVVQDLIDNTGLKLVNFGIGDSEYKRNFANRTDKDCTVLVWRHTLVNRLRAMAILRLHQLKRFIKSRK